MWEIVIKSKATGTTKRVVTSNWGRARDIAMAAASKGLQVSLMRFYTDVLIADHETGDFLIVATRLDPMEASRFSHAMAKDERESGCMLWPHGSPKPLSWRVVRAEA